MRPVLSLTPLNKLFDLNYVNLLDNLYLNQNLIDRIIANPNVIFYDPNKEFAKAYPLIPAYYVSSPDLNSDAQTKRTIYEKVWKKYKEWIYGYYKIFKYIKRIDSTNNFTLVSSLSEGENAKHNVDDTEAKILWVFTNLCDESDIASIVEKYREKKNINLWDVINKKYIDELRDFIYHQIKRKLAKRIENKLL